MSTRFLKILVVWCGLLLLFAPGAVRAQRTATVELYSNRQVLFANNKDTAQLTAQVRDPSGRQFSGNTEVVFQTSFGTLSATRVPVFAGVARVNISSPIKGSALVTASINGMISNTLEIYFTDDPEALYQGNNYVNIQGKSYLSYSTGDQMIDAIGKNAGAKLSFRNLSITADRIQLDCRQNVIRAHDNITLKRGNAVVKASRLHFNLQVMQGYAVVEKEKRLQTVLLSGEMLRMEPQTTPIPNTYFNMRAASVKLVITARNINYFLSSHLQFSSPRFYQDQVQILALPFHEMRLDATELLSDQFVSIGTNGFGLDLPVYYNLSPNTSGRVNLRHQQQIGRSYFAYNPGWAIDVVQSYSQSNRNYDGEVSLLGLTRGDWSLRWLHNHQFTPNTYGNLTVDFPQHNSMLTTTNFSQQQRFMRWGAYVGFGQTFVSNSESSFRSDLFIETQPRKLLGARDMQYTFGTTFNSSKIHSNDPTLGAYNETTEGINMRAFSTPIRLDKRTQLSNSFTVGHIWSDQGRSGLTTLATLSLDHTVPSGGTLSFNYDFVSQPSGPLTSAGKHRLGVTYSMATSRRFRALIQGSAFADTSDATVLGELSYRMSRDWSVWSNVVLQSFEGQRYQDLQFSLARRIGAREIQFTYSTYNKRFSVDFTATRF